MLVEPTALSPSESSDSMNRSDTAFETNGIETLSIDRSLSLMPNSHIPLDNDFAVAPYLQDQIGASAPTMEGIDDDMLYFNPTQNLFQDMDFSSWDLNFDSYTIPQLEVQGPSPRSSTTNSTSKLRRLSRDPSRGHAAFKRSPWLWEPEPKDRSGEGQEGLELNEESIAQSPVYEKMLAHGSGRLKMVPSKRDRLFALVLSQLKDPSKVPSFPSLDLLNYLLQTHFVQAEHQIDSYIHPASFDPSDSLPEFLAAVIANGAAFIAVPAIWQFGYGLHEVVRIALSTLVGQTKHST